MEEEFYLTLLSSSNAGLYSNEAYAFGNRFDPPFEVSENMKVSLAEIQFSHTQAPINIDNEDKPELLIFDFLAAAEKPPAATVRDKRWGKWYKYVIDLTNLRTPEAVCMHLNEKIWQHLPRIRIAKSNPFYYVPEQDRIWYSYEKGQFYCILVKGFLIKYLGLADQESAMEVVCLGLSKRSTGYTFKKDTRLFADTCKDRFQSLCQTKNYFNHSPLTSMIGLSEFVVYCSLVKPNYVGSSLVNHLRFIPLNENNIGKRVCRTFKKMFYYKMSTRLVSDVFIQLRTVEGDYMKLGGVTRVVLHFKKF